jgi:maltose alpha-D-glucosyltransferase/alpha-amylase
MAMARSFDYAPQAVLRAPQKDDDGTIRARREPWARLWTRDVTAAYLRGYFQVVKDAPFLPARREELTLLCRYYELEKVIYELGYEANNRPDWLEIPVRGLASVAAVAAAGSDR